MVNEIFSKEFGGESRRFMAPGRINLIGEHTDYNLGFVMPGAIDKSISLAIKPNGTQKCNIIAANLKKSVCFSVEDANPNIPGWAKYPFGVIKEFQKLGCNPGGFNAVFGGDIPNGAGLSSSAALESAFAIAINSLYNFNLQKVELAKIGQRAEHNYVGVKCGIMDQFASLFSKAEHFMRLDCRDLSVDFFPFKSLGYSILLIDTCVKHTLASSEYNTRRLQCEEGVRIISSKYSNIHSLRDVNLELLKEFQSRINPTIYKRCEYVIEENLRLINTCIALSNNDIDTIGGYLYGSHTGLRDKYEVSCKELDFLVEEVVDTGWVAGARMMGGGFGGCTINLVQTNFMDELKSKVLFNYTKKFGKEPLFYHVNISDGAREIK